MKLDKLQSDFVRCRIDPAILTCPFVDWKTLPKNKGLYSINEKADNSYKQSIINFQNNCKNLRLGYIPGVIRHFYHGKKINRKYTERWKILINHKYNPFLFIKKNNDNLLIPTELCPAELLNDIFNYFKERNEDE